MQINPAFRTVAGTILGESFGNVHFSDTTDPELEDISILQAITRITMEPFATWQELCPDKKSVFLGNRVNSSVGAGEIEQELDLSRSPYRIFLIKTDDPLFLGYQDKWISGSPGMTFSLARSSPGFNPFSESFRYWLCLSLGHLFGDIEYLSDLFSTSYLLFVKYDGFCPYLHRCFHPLAPVWSSGKRT